MKRNKIFLEKYKPIKVKSYELDREKLLKQKINMTSKAIRKKYLALKLGKAEEDESLNKLFSPIVEPLKDIKMNTYIKKVQENIKVDNSKVNEQIPSPRPSTSMHISPSPAPVKFQPTEIIGEVFSEREPEAEASFDDMQAEYNELFKHNKPILDQFLDQFPELSRYYIEGYFTNRDSYDETSGARFDNATNKLFIGNKELHFGENNELIIDDRQYAGTKGLYELIFMKNPVGRQTKDDLKNYKEILELTSAHKRGYQSQGQIKGHKHYKYMGIIKPLFESRLRTKSMPSRSGSGYDMNMAVYNEKPIEYVYWDDVNELVDRLRLLIASKSAGNTDSHNNEILAIISELKEIGVIA